MKHMEDKERYEFSREMQGGGTALRRADLAVKCADAVRQYCMHKRVHIYGDPCRGYRRRCTGCLRAVS